MTAAEPSSVQVPYFRPLISDAAINEVVDCLRSGWLTTGPRTAEFERQFAAHVGAKHSIAVNSCTAALHLAVEALGLRPGQAVLVPSLTFASTAEVVRYQGGVPILVDCDPESLNIDLNDAAAKLEALRRSELPVSSELQPVGIIPVHVGGAMLDMNRVRKLADEHQLWVVEDAAHAFPAAIRASADSPWQRCGEATADVTCFSFYTNKTITTGEGGMAVTEDPALAQRMRQMSLHGLSNDAWNRYSGNGNWDYQIVAPGYKYNMTDVAAALGIHQLRQAESLRLARQQIAARYHERLSSIPQIQLPVCPEHRVHSWHLYPIRLQLAKLSIDRNEFMTQLRACGVGCSVHWRPLHLHPYYEQTFGWMPEHLPVASKQWQRLISLPIFPGMTDEELGHVIHSIGDLCRRFAR